MPKYNHVTINVDNAPFHTVRMQIVWVCVSFKFQAWFVRFCRMSLMKLKIFWTKYHANYFMADGIIECENGMLSVELGK